MRDVLEAARAALRRVKWLRDPMVVQALRSAAAASIAYVIAVRLTPDKSAAPLTAPLTALLVVQVTLYATLKMSFRRVNAVVAGVLVAIAFSQLVGLSWWSLALIIVAALGVGHLVRAEEFTAEVAISAMLVLGVTSHGSLAWARVVETLIGAIVGLVFNLILAPPVWVEQAGESVVGLARQVRQLLLRMGEEAAGSTPFHQAAARLHEARRLDHDIGEVDEDLRQAEDSLRFNPRVREGLLHRVVLRTGLDTLEICTVVMRVLARSFTDLAKEREPEPCSRRRRAPPSSSCCPRSPTPWSASRSWSPATPARTPSPRRSAWPPSCARPRPPGTGWPTCCWRRSGATRPSGSCGARCWPR